MSRPDKVFFPPVNWKATKNYAVEQDVGPAVEHIYEVITTFAVHALSSELRNVSRKSNVENRVFLQRRPARKKDSEYIRVQF